MDISLFALNHNEANFLPYSNQIKRINGQSQATLDMQSSNQKPQNSSQYTSTSLSRSSGSSEPPCDPPATGKWAPRLLMECARAVSEKDSSKMNHLLWMLNELASPYGDCDQKLASYFLQALFCKATESGLRCFKTLTSVAEKSHSFDSARKLILKFQEVSPWTTFGHVASNGAILEALEGETKLHIIDISNTLCTQWPTLLEALATRNNEETPRLKLTVVVTAGSNSTVTKSVMKEISQRMEKFARLMGVPFEINVMFMNSTSRLNNLTKESFGVEEDEAIAVNCIGALRRVGVEERGALIQMFQSLRPRVVTVVEEEADLLSSVNDFVKCFEECLRFYTLYFDMLEESFVPTSNERLMLERECSRSIVRVLGCFDTPHEHHDHGMEEDDEINGEEYHHEMECERRERGRQWSKRLKAAAFSPVGFSDDVVDDVKALLKRYKAGWAVEVPQLGSEEDDQSTHQTPGIYLTWKEEPVVWASTWKPASPL